MERTVRKYTYVTLCRDALNDKIFGPYLSDDELVIFDTKEAAFETAEKAAREEAEGLNDGCDEGISFGIPEDGAYENKDSVKVCYYYNNNTEIVTERFIRIIKEA